MGAITETKNFNGSVTLSTIAHGRLCWQTYYFYTKRERTKLFRDYVNTQT